MRSKGRKEGHDLTCMHSRKLIQQRQQMVSDTSATLLTTVCKQNLQNYASSRLV